jgi:anti-repressor protein
MNESISIYERQVGAEVIKTVNARALHKFLEIGTAFKDWFPRRVEEFLFVQGIDYAVSFLSVDEGGDGVHHFHVSIDMAKELSMVERTPKGKEARQYFIECERRALMQPPRLDDPAALRTLLLGYTERVIALEQTVEAQKPAVEFVAKYVKADGNKGFRQVCQLLNVRSEREFANWLVDAGIMYRLDGKLTPMANQRHTGRFEVKAGVTNDERAHAFNQTKFTPRGIEWVAGEWAKHQVRQPALI